jgi:hypothetical protein
MLVKPNCRWASGVCDLINGALKIHITADTQAYGPMGDFFKPCPSRAKAGFKKSPSG